MDYNIISADDHIDLGYLPPDFWSRNMSRAHAQRAPRVEERDGSALWVCEDRVWGSWRGEWPGGNRRPDRPVTTALERGGHDDYGERRPAAPELRLADMDRDGVHTHVIYGPIFSIKADDPELRDACYAAYNDSLAEFAAAAPDRLLGVAMLPPAAVSATKELLRLAKMGGWKQANLQIAEVEPRLHDPAWDALWRALEETGIILSFHVAVFDLARSDPAFGKPAASFALAKAFIGQFLDPFVDLFAWGILERHPKIRLTMAESGLGWVPWVVQELDHRFELMWENKGYWDRHGGIPLEARPSEIFKRQIYASFQDDPVAIRLLPFMGEGHVMWASDYPHPDSTWPNSRTKIDAQMKDLPAATRKQLLHDNAATLYGLVV